MAIMDTNSENHQYQYIQDNSMASLDSKTSPLAMLVRTCSQIGADPPTVPKSKKPPTPATTPMTAADRPHSASPAAAYHLSQTKRNYNNNYIEDPKPAKLNFKPYENTVLTHNNNNDDDSRPRSSSSEDNNASTKKRKSASPRDDCLTAAKRRAPETEQQTANPIIRSGLEVMHGTKGFCPPPPSSYKSDALAAFRHTYLPGAPWMAASLAAAAAAAAHHKPAGGDCKDPICLSTGGCAASAVSPYHHSVMAAVGCPAGCTQCDQQRYLSSLMAAAAPFYAPSVARPYTCSWVIPSPSSPATESPAAAPSLCGKSFSTSEELLQHIRTHTSAAGPMSPTTAAAAAAFSAYNNHLSRHLFHHPAAASPYGASLPYAGKHMPPPSPYSAFNPTTAYYPGAAAAAAAAAYHHQLYAVPGRDGSATVSR
ncbi:zinc finger protein Noc-like [Daktulosphaira vitifoliae]|uniref:zinc finger protein Noc-like n=1 Tax=Daktulosphaira vitifoliae TaxID=58002 RepID=UPI0021AAD372|nr:zinc finger protein Noc-like [Daktulosphaira vitifoliae]